MLNIATDKQTRNAVLLLTIASLVIGIVVGWRNLTATKAAEETNAERLARLEERVDDLEEA
tara:strand:- start:2555 stop:2737 length:183 start_codon:yes stop_codon:yes gene_type:complete